MVTAGMTKDTEQKGAQQTGTQQSGSQATSSSSTGQKKSIWLTIVEKVRNWCDKFIKKHDKSAQTDASQAGKDATKSSFAKTDEFVHTEKDDALLNKQFNQIDSLGLKNDNYLTKYASIIASMDSVEDFDKGIFADASMRFLVKDAGAENGKDLSFEGMDNLAVEFAPEAFSNAEQASKYWDDLSNAAVNSGYAGAKMKEMQDASYAQTDEYKAIMADYSNRTASIKEAYGEDGKRIEQEFVNAYKQFNGVQVSDEDRVDFTRRVLTSGAILENGEKAGKDFTDADYQTLADGIKSGERDIFDVISTPDAAEAEEVTGP